MIYFAEAWERGVELLKAGTLYQKQVVKGAGCWRDSIQILVYTEFSQNIDKNKKKEGRKKGKRKNELVNRLATFYLMKPFDLPAESHPDQKP